MLPSSRKGAAVQKKLAFSEITATADIQVRRHGARAKCLQRLVRLDMPVPRSVALPFEAVRDIAAGHDIDTAEILRSFGEFPLVSVRPSAETADWGGPGTLLNIGMNAQMCDHLATVVGQEAANQLYLRFVQSFSVEVARLDEEEFADDQTLKDALHTYELEMEEPFPESASEQLTAVLRSMARAWEGTTARLLRQAKGAPPEAALGLVVQRMALGLGTGECGSGVVQFIDPVTGLPQITGRYKNQAQGRGGLLTDRDALYLTRDPRGPSLEERCPAAFAELIAHGARARSALREEMQIEFTVEDGDLRILDAVRVPRSSRAAVRVAVSLARDGVIPREEALMRVEPQALAELLHPQVDRSGATDVFARGIAASPGAATGRIVFNAGAAQAAAAKGEACILVRHETSPEDIRGMHAAKAVLTERGGVTSHAAVIARGLGVPCVVGASSLQIDSRNRTLATSDGRSFREGDTITINGSSGEALAGEVVMLPPALDEVFQTFMEWAEDAGDIGIRTNSDTPADAETASRFGAQGIGLCRTEHMFFDADRLTVMREMIFADTSADRQAALERLMPMQRGDFRQLFEIMQGKPVCIRLFDPPLNEFLPKTRDGVRQLAEAMDLPVSRITRRVEALSEFNPMLGMRGVRLGITVPEIYDMQARAIFEAAADVALEGHPVEPEIMIPLVSARREVELVKSRIDATASAVRTHRGVDFRYQLGVMVETPRAALRAGEIADHVSFLSFGTNDLTQMTYGLSRDDAGRFMGTYVQQGVYPEDPFHTLDIDGVGELLLIAAERARAVRKDLTLSVCGEHGGNAESIAFCRSAGFDYVSCSAYRVPVARLAAAQLAISEMAPKGRATISQWITKHLRIGGPADFD
ncbi:putative PEP-binding protein [Brevirhabdus sp.]|uniref:putative PEP-binding protein n=1 Tax=Brevirhabdus sp. TaxID=2004514 RepID=UPI004059E54F